jgi:hypothetical protein
MLITVWAITLLLLLASPLLIWMEKQARLWTVGWSLMALCVVMVLWTAQRCFQAALYWRSAYLRCESISRSQWQLPPQSQLPRYQLRDSVCHGDRLGSTQFDHSVGQSAYRKNFPNDLRGGRAALEPENCGISLTEDASYPTVFPARWQPSHLARSLVLRVHPQTPSSADLFSNYQNQAGPTPDPGALGCKQDQLADGVRRLVVVAVLRLDCDMHQFFVLLKPGAISIAALRLVRDDRNDGSVLAAADLPDVKIRHD